MQPFSHWWLALPGLTANGIWRERWRKGGKKRRALPVQRDPIEGSFSSMLGLQRPLCVTIDQAAPSSHSGAPLYGATAWFPLRPRGSLKAYERQKQSHHQIDLESFHHRFKVIVVRLPVQPLNDRMSDLKVSDAELQGPLFSAALWDVSYD